MANNDIRHNDNCMFHGVPMVFAYFFPQKSEKRGKDRYKMYQSNITAKTSVAVFTAINRLPLRTDILNMDKFIPINNLLTHAYVEVLPAVRAICASSQTKGLFLE
jgi:hypothetical protein